MKKLTRAVAIGAVLGLATLTVGQSAVFAEDLPMPGSMFLVNDGDPTYVGDWYSYLNPDAKLYGWTNDAFDGWGVVTLVDENSNDWTLNQATPDSVTTAPDGTTTVVFSGNTSDALMYSTSYDVTATITLQGSFAKWSVDIARIDSAPVDANLFIVVTGTVGANDQSIFDRVDHTLVSSDGGINDPVVAWQATHVGGSFPAHPWSATDGNDQIQASAYGSTNLSVIAAMVEWDPCSYDAALAYAESIKTTLVDNFGTELEPLQACLTVAPLSLNVGTPVTSTLSYSIPANATDPDGFWRFFGYNDPEFIFNPVTVDIQGLPAGVTFTQSQDPATGVVTIRLAGTPTESGSFAPTVTIARVHYDGDTAPLGLTGFASPLATDFTEPLEATGSITVGTSLANTGVNGAQNAMLLGIGGGILVLGAAALIILAVRRRNSAKRDDS